MPFRAFLKGPEQELYLLKYTYLVETAETFQDIFDKISANFYSHGKELELIGFFVDYSNIQKTSANKQANNNNNIDKITGKLKISTVLLEAGTFKMKAKFKNHCSKFAKFGWPSEFEFDVNILEFQEIV